MQRGSHCSREPEDSHYLFDRSKGDLVCPGYSFTYRISIDLLIENKFNICLILFDIVNIAIKCIHLLLQGKLLRVGDTGLVCIFRN